MKKAFLDQLLFGFILALAILTFVATVNDETSTRNRINDLKDLARSSSQAVARYYEEQIDMCEGQNVNDDILKQTILGNMVLDNNLISYSWEDTSGDGQPDRVTTTIAAHGHDTFWYKFFDKDSFNIGPFSESEDIDVPVNVNISFGSEDAGYRNMAGTYTLDANNCVQDVELILEDSKRSGLSEGDQLGSEITSPPTYLFIIANGYNTFTNGGDTPRLSDSITMSHCFDDVTDDTSNPTVTMNGKSVTNANMYFEHEELNGDGNYEHLQIIPKSIWNTYTSYIASLSGNAKDKYQQFVAYADALNSDNDPTNDIDYENDPNDEYYYAMEDLNGGGDQDFNDLVLDSTRVAIPNELNDFTVNNDGTISLNCDDNTNPIVTISGCPLTINEDESSSAISWTATDTDGTVTETTASATNGTTIVNNNGTITYTPISNYYGTDTITFKATDNEGAVAFGYCEVTVTEVNDAPTISGTPTTTIKAGNSYSFTPTAEDIDGDTLSFTVANLPSWASFNSTTGALTGTPSDSDEGIYTNITITVNDSRGASASLSPFSITVTADNDVLLVSAIPDQTIAEDNIYAYDYSTHFSSSKSLTYTVTYSFNGSSGTINLTGSSFSLTVPDNTAGQVATITVVASNGINQASDTYTVTVEDKTGCNGPFEVNFNNNTDSFAGGNRDGKSYRIDGGSSGGRIFDFGSGCINKDVTVNYTFKTTGNWEDSERLKVYSNSNRIGRHKQKTSWKTVTKTTTTDNAGLIELEFFVDTSKDNERAWIDDIILTAE